LRIRSNRVLQGVTSPRPIPVRRDDVKQLASILSAHTCHHHSKPRTDCVTLRSTDLLTAEWNTKDQPYRSLSVTYPVVDTNCPKCSLSTCSCMRRQSAEYMLRGTSYVSMKKGDMVTGRCGPSPSPVMRGNVVPMRNVPPTCTTYA
jgi:hypothetical protein